MNTTRRLLNTLLSLTAFTSHRLPTSWSMTPKSWSMVRMVPFRLEKRHPLGILYLRSRRGRTESETHFSRRLRRRSDLAARRPLRAGVLENPGFTVQVEVEFDDVSMMNPSSLSRTSSIFADRTFGEPRSRFTPMRCRKPGSRTDPDIKAGRPTDVIVGVSRPVRSDHLDDGWTGCRPRRLPRLRGPVSRSLRRQRESRVVSAHFAA